MNAISNPRKSIEDMIRREDLEGLLLKAGELHGHFCPYVALGVRAGVVALGRLQAVHNTGMEEIVAIVETNNCFADGVQMVTGCTFANNALIYRDLGKTAVTIAKRDGEALRVAVRPDWPARSAARYPQAQDLFDKIVKRREPATEKEQARLHDLWQQRSFDNLEPPAEEIFTLERKRIELPAYAPIMDSVTCSVCGESVMESRGRFQEGEPICLDCAQRQHHVLDGSGIHVRQEGFDRS